VVRVLLIADTHLGFDLPQRPRSERPRRGPDFFANFELALEPARRGNVDLVVHAGDLLFRSRVRQELVRQAFEPMLEVADRGVDVLLVPGNHERSALPFPILAAHRHFHVFDRPRTVRLGVAGATVAVTAFPCVRDGIASRFASLADAARDEGAAGVRLLCLHQTVEGARVGPAGFTFRGGDDVIPGRLIHAGFAAVLAGHIHRRQVLTHDLAGRPLAAPVLYPGSIERTSFAERDEEKGCLIVELEPDEACGGRLAGWKEMTLPTRPMRRLRFAAHGLSDRQIALRIEEMLNVEPANAVVRLCVAGATAESQVWRAATLRLLHPPGMIVEVRFEQP
jgi:DNA repair exonuclease SbcCD nuclease subunit